MVSAMPERPAPFRCDNTPRLVARRRSVRLSPARPRLEPNVRSFRHPGPQADRQKTTLNGSRVTSAATAAVDPKRTKIHLVRTKLALLIRPGAMVDRIGSVTTAALHIQRGFGKAAHLAGFPAAAVVAPLPGHLFQHSVRLPDAEDADQQRRKHRTRQNDEQDPAEMVGAYEIQRACQCHARPGPKTAEPISPGKGHRPDPRRERRPLCSCRG